MKQILSILQKEFLIDYRQWNKIAAVILFLLCSCYIAYRVFGNINPMNWNAIYWIIYLYIAITVVLKGFSNDGLDRQLFYYTLYKAEVYFLAKCIYNTLLLWLSSLLLAFALSIFSGVGLAEPFLFAFSLMLSCIGISVLFSFVGIINFQAGANTTLFSVLAMPIALPIILLMLKFTAISLGILATTDLSTDLILLVGIDVLFLGVSLLLISYLWKA